MSPGQTMAAIFSGPAAGVIGSQAIGKQIGTQNILTIDIGGTSFDVGVVVSGKPIMRSDIALAGAEIRVHSIDVASIGAGGGSIASVHFQELRVGPQSAGANPGPACYGRGGQKPTATDADLVLGVLDPDNFLGGRMKLDVNAAVAAIEKYVAEPLGMAVVEAAWAIREVLDNRMADLLRRMTVERGYDPRDFVLFANGGAGPSHAWVLGAELNLDGFIVPAAATAQSAFGTANSNIRFTVERPVYARIAAVSSASPDQIQQISSALQSVAAEVRRNIASAVSSGNVGVERMISLRYRGQSHHIDVRVSQDEFSPSAYSEVIANFEREYETLFGHGAGFSQAGYEILSVRAVGIADLPPPARRSKGQPLSLIGKRPVIFRDPRSPVETAIYRTEFPESGAAVEGPCIIEFPGQSVVIPPAARVKADECGNLHVRFAK